MTVTLDLQPEVTAYAASQAAAHGISVEAYLEQVLSVLVASPSPRRISDEDFEAGLDELAAGEPLPVLSDAATIRAGIYADHD